MIDTGSSNEDVKHFQAQPRHFGVLQTLAVAAKNVHFTASPANAVVAEAHLQRWHHRDTAANELDRTAFPVDRLPLGVEPLASQFNGTSISAAVAVYDCNDEDHEGSTAASRTPRHILHAPVLQGYLRRREDSLTCLDVVTDAKEATEKKEAAAAPPPPQAIGAQTESSASPAALRQFIDLTALSAQDNTLLKMSHSDELLVPRTLLCRYAAQSSGSAKGGPKQLNPRHAPSKKRRIVVLPDGWDSTSGKREEPPFELVAISLRKQLSSPSE